MTKDEALKILELGRIIDRDWSNPVGYQKSFTEALETIKNLLGDVPVIRCKDCKHAKVSENSFGFDGQPLCKCGYMAEPNRWDEFCSWAERKEDETKTES